jgi:hypothetical protein
MAYYFLLTAHYLRVAASYLLHTRYYSMLTTYNLLFATHCSLIITYDLFLTTCLLLLTVYYLGFSPDYFLLHSYDLLLTTYHFLSVLNLHDLQLTTYSLQSPKTAPETAERCPEILQICVASKCIRFEQQKSTIGGHLGMILGRFGGSWKVFWSSWGFGGTS